MPGEVDEYRVFFWVNIGCFWVKMVFEIFVSKMTCVCALDQFCHGSNQQVLLLPPVNDIHSNSDVLTSLWVFTSMVIFVPLLTYLGVLYM